MQLDTHASQTLSAGNSSEQIGYAEAKEVFQRNTKWWTVFAAFDLCDFNPSPLWISKKTGVSVEEVVEALEGLTVLGYLKKENGSFNPVKGKEFSKFDWSGKTKGDIIDEHAVVSQQILNEMHVDTTIAYDHRFLAGNKDIIVELYKDIQAAFDKAFMKAQENKSANDAIYNITFTGVDVIKAHDTKGRGQ